jgi:hypothetical protein
MEARESDHSGRVRVPTHNVGTRSFNMARTNPKGTELKLLNIQLGIQEVLTQGKTMTFRGMASDASTLGGTAASFLAPYKAVEEQRATLRSTIQTRRSQSLDARKWAKDFQIGALATFGEDSVEYQKFGFKPRKANAALTPEKKQLKVERLRATRKARNTLGSRERQAVKGNVPTPAPGASGGTIPVK